MSTLFRNKHDKNKEERAKRVESGWLQIMNWW